MTLQTYLATIESPMNRAKAEAALTRTQRWDGRYAWRHAEMERRVAAGATIELSRQGTRKLINPSGSFLDESQITATAMDYARWLIDRRDMQ